MKILYVVILLIVGLSVSQYQQCTFLKGNLMPNQEAIFSEYGTFLQENSIGGISDSETFLLSSSNNTEMMIFFGTRAKDMMTDQIWIFSTEIKQWKILKGRKPANQTAIYSQEAEFSDSNQIGSRRSSKGWKNADETIFTFFGGRSTLCAGCGSITESNEIWTYNKNSNQWAVIHSLDATNLTELYGFYESKKSFSSLNIPGARSDHLVFKINENRVFLLGGKGFYHVDNRQKGMLNDYWELDTTNYLWKFLGGNLMEFEPTTNIGPKGSYSTNTTFGARSGMAGLMLNEEEIMIIGGNYPGSVTNTNLMLKYNISSNLFMYVGGGSWQPTFGRVYNPNNIIRKRDHFGVWQINDDEIMIFGGFASGAESAQGTAGGLTRDEWLYSLSKNQWKYTGKEQSKIIDRPPFKSSSSGYSDDTILASVYYFNGAYNYESKELFICNGQGTTAMNTIGFQNDCWRIYKGNMCYSLEDTNPSVCGSNGKCVKNDQCSCNSGYYGDLCQFTMCHGILSNESDVCSKNGICIDSKCKCFGSNFLNPDCSTDYATKSFVENLWIGAVIIGGIIGVIIIIAISIYVVCKLKKRLKRFDKIEDIDLILQEQELEQKESKEKKVQLKINKDLFEVNYKDITLIKSIGEGGSNSSIYLAKWKGIEIAYKSLKCKNIFDSDISYDEFEKEVEIFSSVNHPNILQFYGACINPPKVGILLQFCQNGDVCSFISKYRLSKKNGYPLVEKMRLLKEISSGMAYLHSVKLIHRDLKPENVLVDKNENAQIMDFGLSKLNVDSEKTMTKQIGTTSYMAPELISEKNKRYSNKCDVYSFAVLALVVITENFFPYGVNSVHTVTLKNVMIDPMFRPEIDEEKFKDCKFMIPLIKKNWDADPNKRNTFDELYGILAEDEKKKKRGNQEK